MSTGNNKPKPPTLRERVTRELTQWAADELAKPGAIEKLHRRAREQCGPHDAPADAYQLADDVRAAMSDAIRRIGGPRP